MKQLTDIRTTGNPTSTLVSYELVSYISYLANTKTLSTTFTSTSFEHSINEKNASPNGKNTSEPNKKKNHKKEKRR